jgi:AraC-like DNA-binding protein
MYRRPYLAHSAVIEEVARRMRCCRRQIERAFRVFEASPARELRAIRTELAAACLVDPNSREKTERVIAQRVGLTDDRALRRVMAARWGIPPSRLRRAADLQRHLRWREAAGKRRRGERRPGIEAPFEPAEDSYCSHIRKLLADALGDAPIEVRRLAEGELQLPSPTQAAERASKLATERVTRQWIEHLREADLAA